MEVAYCKQVTVAGGCLGRESASYLILFALAYNDDSVHFDAVQNLSHAVNSCLQESANTINGTFCREHKVVLSTGSVESCFDNREDT